MLELKKTLVLALAALVCAMALAGCAGGGNAPVTLHVYNWGDYIGEGVIDLFTQETGIQVVYSMYETNEDMYTKLKSTGGEGYDVIFPSDYIIQKLIAEDMLVPIRYENVPNMALIDEKYKDLSFDPGNVYSVPYMWGTLGILYNTTMVEGEIDSWNALWDARYERNVFMLDSMRDSIGLTLKLLGYSLNTRDTAQLTAARDKLIAQKPLAYVGDQVKDQMIAGEAALAVVYSGDAVTCMGMNEDLAYVVPKEGSNIWFDNMCILKATKHQKEAELFVNFMCRTDVAEMNRDYINFSSPQREVYENLPAEIKNDPAQYPDDAIYRLCEPMEDLGELTQLYDEYWTQVLAH